MQYSTFVSLAALAATVKASSLPVISTTTAVPSSSDTNVYVDVTVTPTVTASTNVEATVTAQSTFTSVYNSSSSTTSIPAISSFVNEANGQQVALGFAGLAGLAAVLL